jgi:hypothetical protein
MVLRFDWFSANVLAARRVRKKSSAGSSVELVVYVEQERRDLYKMVDVGVHHISRHEVQGAELFRSGDMVM